MNLTYILTFLVYYQRKFIITLSEYVDNGHFAYRDVIISLENSDLKIVNRYFSPLEEVEYYFITKHDSYRFYSIQDFHNYMSKLDPKY